MSKPTDIVFYDSVCKTCGSIALAQKTREIADSSASIHEGDNAGHEVVVLPIPRKFSARAVYDVRRAKNVGVRRG